MDSSAKSGDKIQRIPEVGVKKLTSNESSVETIEDLRREHRERSKQERLELAYEGILKDPVAGNESEDESTDEDYCPENDEDNVTVSEDGSSDDDYTPSGDEFVKRNDDSETNEEIDDSSIKGLRRSKRLASKTA